MLPHVRGPQYSHETAAGHARIVRNEFPSPYLQFLSPKFPDMQDFTTLKRALLPPKIRVSQESLFLTGY